ncbi:hypothetical protein [Bosea sp. MMO-172]|uniref:hypothetical protein n=1 Tax=Bosea sp. MMO-172 TaxID=3127885 RepID=UPI0030176FD8
MNNYFSRRSVGFEGEFAFDDSKPDGTPRKLMNVGKLATLGWHAQTSLPAGIDKTYQAFKEISW